MKNVKSKNHQGFTLVELLITVVIIGLLAAMGVPQYRKMVQKAKKAEAQTLLGAIYTAEETFFSEYGTYGTNLAKMGINMKSTPKLLYRGGFLDGSCANKALFPTSVSGFSSYDDAGTYSAGLGRNGQAVCNDGSEIDTKEFRAIATGYIRQTDVADEINGCDGDIAKCDVWSIDQDGLLDNLNDGVE